MKQVIHLEEKDIAKAISAYVKENFPNAGAVKIRMKSTPVYGYRDGPMGDKITAEAEFEVGK